jgi:outer membrane protein OmpA-like peptidoglycan-associated protein
MCERIVQLIWQIIQFCAAHTARTAKTMKNHAATSAPFPSQLAVFLLASALGIPALAQQAQPVGTPQDTPPSVAQQQPAASSSANASKEGFWGRVNPFARKKWVKRQTDPINDRLTELDGLNAKNAKDIQDVDSRAQAGIRQAQTTADAANQTATAAGTQAQLAGTTAQGAAGHVNQLNGTVNGLDQYHQVTEAEVKFRGGQPILSAEARTQLDDLAASVNGQHGYILEVEGHSPLAGSAGIQSSGRLAEAVKRYLVTQHEIPVYRMHAVALGNARSASDEDAAPVRTSSVHIRLMENSLAAQGAAPPQGVASSTGAERP